MSLKVEASASTQRLVGALASHHAHDPASLPFSMSGAPHVLAAQNNYTFEDLVAKGRRQNPKWNLADIEYASSSLGARAARAITYSLAVCGACDGGRLNE